MKTRSKKQRKLLSELENNPLIERACKKVGVARSTYYRWRDSDPEFREETEKATIMGREKMNDFVESKLLEAINSGSMQGIRYWLDHNSKTYALVSVNHRELQRLRQIESIYYELAQATATYGDHMVLDNLRSIREKVSKEIADERDKNKI